MITAGSGVCLSIPQSQVQISAPGTDQQGVSFELRLLRVLRRRWRERGRAPRSGLVHPQRRADAPVRDGCQGRHRYLRQRIRLPQIATASSGNTREPACREVSGRPVPFFLILQVINYKAIHSPVFSAVISALLASLRRIGVSSSDWSLRNSKSFYAARPCIQRRDAEDAEKTQRSIRPTPVTGPTNSSCVESVSQSSCTMSHGNSNTSHIYRDLSN